MQRLTDALVRLDGWEGRLAAVLKAARTQPYVLGQHDCFSTACAVIHALTGRDFWTDWGGTYSSRQQALKRLVEFAGQSSPEVFTVAFTRLFGAAPEAMVHAQRGDIAEFVDATGEPHLGVVSGAHVLVLGEHGLASVPRTACRHVWRIG